VRPGGGSRRAVRAERRVRRVDRPHAPHRPDETYGHDYRHDRQYPHPLLLQVRRELERRGEHRESRDDIQKGPRLEGLWHLAVDLKRYDAPRDIEGRGEQDERAEKNELPLLDVLQGALLVLSRAVADVVGEVGEEHAHYGHERHGVERGKVLLAPRSTRVQGVLVKLHTGEGDAQQREGQNAGAGHGWDAATFTEVPEAEQHGVDEKDDELEGQSRRRARGTGRTITMMATALSSRGRRRRPP